MAIAEDSTPAWLVVHSRYGNETDRGSMSQAEVGYGPLVGHNQQGYPIYLYTDPKSKLRYYVVVLPDDRAFYCDQRGSLSATPVEADKGIALALIGGTAGFLIGGPVGALIGALGGLILSELPKKAS